MFMWVVKVKQQRRYIKLLVGGMAEVLAGNLVQAAITPAAVVVEQVTFEVEEQV